MTNQETIETVVNDACLSLFEDYSLPLVRQREGVVGAGDNLLFCGVIGFSGQQMRGTLLLATSSEPLGRTSPTSATSLREWIAELSNQLLGRIKNKLLAYGVTIHLSIPIVLRGQHIAPVGPAELLPFGFTCEGGFVCVWFDAEMAAGFDMTLAVELEAANAEGTTTLF